MFEFGDMTYLSSYKIPFYGCNDVNGVYIKTLDGIDDKLEFSIKNIFKDKSYTIRSVESMIKKDKDKGE